MSEEEKLIGYCFKCKEKREMLNPKAEFASNGSPGTRATCVHCGGTIYKTGRTPAHDDLPPPVIVPRAKKSGKTKKRKTKKKKGTAVRRSGKLVIVESPAKAKTIGRYLGRGYTVKSSVGHVRDLLKSRLSVDVEHDFEPEYRVPNDKRPLVKELKLAAAKANEIYLATDSDREGEAIAWHVLESAEMEPERTQRVVFNEITKSAILAAFEEPREIDMNQVNAQQARRILDRLVGYKLSPLLWRKVHGRLSAGRVQSVAVRLVVEREREIDAFDSVEYWTIEAELSQEKYQDEDKRPYFIAKLFKLNREEPVLGNEADVLVHLDVLEKGEWRLGDVRIGKRTRRPAAPFTTSTLQQEASRKLSFNTSKTMRIAQQLYEGVALGGSADTVGLITYMRTDSVTVSADAQKETRSYVSNRFGTRYVPVKPPVYKTKSKNAQEAHEAVRPTSVMRVPKEIKTHLSRDQYRLYTLIWDRFVASQMSPARYNTVSADIWVGEVTVAIKERPYLFRATGSDLEFPGFLALYEETRPEDKPDDGENKIPSDLQKDTLVDLMRLLPDQHFTQPPPRFSEATLVKALEENGIGRPSTYSSIISTIQRRGYVERENRRLYPTETGGVVNDMLVEYFPDILSAGFTATLEEQLDKVAEGAPWVPVIANFYKKFEVDLQRADEALPKVDLKREPELVGRECPTCSNPLVYRDGRYGRFIGCSTFPKCRYTEQILNKVGVSCQNGGEIIKRKTKRGRTFYGCSRYPDCEWRSWNTPVIEAVSEPCDGIWVENKNKERQCVACGLKEGVPAVPLPEPEPAVVEAAPAD